MSLPYQDYAPQMDALYDKARRGTGRIALYGPPGAGLDKFIESFLEKYGDSLREQNIYCCSVDCRRTKNAKAFFTEILYEIVRILKLSSVSNLFPQSAAELFRKYEVIVDMTDQMDNFSIVRDFRDATLDFFACFGETFGQKISVRLFITGFDSVRKLFANVDETYSYLFLDIYDKNSAWFGVTVTSHRTIDLIAEKFDSLTSYSARFRCLNVELSEDFPADTDAEPVAPISRAFLGGFNQKQMREFYRLTSELLQEPLEPEVKRQIFYYCGTNPRRLSIFYEALAQIAKTDGAFSQEMKIKQAFRDCKNQLDEQLQRFVDCMEDIAPDKEGVKTFQRAVSNPFVPEPSPFRKTLIDMGILCYECCTDEFGSSQTRIVPCIGALWEYLFPKSDYKPNLLPKSESELNSPSQTRNKPPSLPLHAPSAPLHILHLSDLHFNSRAEESEREANTAYLREFFEQLKRIQTQTPVNYVCFSGDIGMAGGQEDDYQQAKEEISKILQTLQLTPDRFLPCPGNHDQDLSHKHFFEYPPNAEAANKCLDFSQFDYISKDFQNYISLCQNLSCESYAIGSHQSYLTGVRDCGAFVAVCLNTAWFSMRDKDDKPMPSWVGPHFVDAISNQLAVPDMSGKRVLTLMHHPVEEWAEEERALRPGYPLTWSKVTKFSDYILCGHTHETGFIPQTVNGRAKILSGCCLYENSLYPNGFCSYFFSDKQMEIVRYSYRDGKWLEDKEKFDSPKASCAP